jgi:mRNA interferase MazF
MRVSRGDVVLVDYPFSDAGGQKVRPTLVVQADSRNAIMTHTVLAMITKNTSRVGIDPSQVLVDIPTPDGQRSGLNVTSAVTCGNLATVHEDRIKKKIGELSALLMQQVNAALKNALDLP